MTATDADLCYISAVEAIDLFKKKKLSPVELLKAQINRADAVNGVLNAFTHTYYDRALKQAKEAEDRYFHNNDVRPLEGVTCAIKDFHSVAGEITTYGSRAFADFVPEKSAPTVQRLLDAGIIMHCRTTTPEFAHAGVTHSPLWGVTRNPWNPEFSPGGSSGGAGAALAAGMTTLADGTDGGGSIRIPSAMSGLFGYKAPWGRNPTDIEHPGETLLHYGPMTRSVADAALMQNVMSGAHPDDLYSLREEVKLPISFEPLKGARIALSMDLGYFAVDPEMRTNTLKAAQQFRDMGCIVEEIDLGWEMDSQDMWLTIWESLFWSLMSDMLPKWHNEFDPYVVKILERGKNHTAKDTYSAHALRFKMYEKLSKVFANYDYLIAPTVATTQIKADRDNDDPITIDGKSINPYIGWFMTYPFNLVSQCPVMSVPTGFTPSNGVPTGMQIAGRTFDDLSVFRAAAAFESATQPWLSNRPNI